MITTIEKSLSGGKRLHEAGLRRTALAARATRRTLLGLLLVLPALLNAAVCDVIVWSTLRTTTDMTSTRDNGYPTNMTNMRLWWKLSAAGNLGDDATNNGRNAKIKGVVQGLPMTDQFGASRTVATGFNTPDSFVVGNPGFTDGKTADRTYEFWIRNPEKNDSVFFSITQSEMGQYKAAEEDDLLRMWINPNGSITVADRGLPPDPDGYYRLPESVPLTWTNNKWYQIVVVFDSNNPSSGQHNVKVYRGSRANPVELVQLCNYTAASYGTGTQHWVAIGGHSQNLPTYPGSYARPRKNDVSKPGFLGCDGPGTAPTINLDSYTDTSGDDTYAWRKACAVISAYGQGTLQLTAGKTYVVGKETAGAVPDFPYYRADGLGLIAGAKHGKIIVNGNGATVKLKGGMHVGGFDPTTGLADPWDSDLDPDDYLKERRAAPGNLLTVERCADVEIKNITLNGNIQNQVYGGIYGDKGYQVPQHGIFLGGTDLADANGKILVQDVVSSYNTVDGISIGYKVEAVDPIKEVIIRRITCKYNGRQGLSYNCGNHLEVYDSEFSHTGRERPNYPNSPATGVDIEPMGRYMAPGIIFDNCKFFDNRSLGLLLLHAPPSIFRNCTMWGTTNNAIKAGFSVQVPPNPDMDHDHLFIGCYIYGGFYHANAQRIRFDGCFFNDPVSGTAYYSAEFPNAPVTPAHGIYEGGVEGSVILSGCTIQAQHKYIDDQPANIDGTPRSENKSGDCPVGVVLQNCEVTHGNWSSLQPLPATAAKVGFFANSYFVNTTFRETSVFGGAQASNTYWIDIGSGATLSAIGPGNRIEGPTATSPHYVLWGTNTPPAGKPWAPVPLAATATGVLTPNADTSQSAGETQINTGATYTASRPFTNPADSTGMRLFNGDPTGGGWNNTVGINDLDVTVTIDLKSTRNVRAAKMKFNHPDNKPWRVIATVSNSPTPPADTAPERGNLGLVRPSENTFLTPWWDATVPTPLSGRYVHLQIENDMDGLWYIDEVKVYGN
jgi:hypothetical protein